MNKAYYALGTIGLHEFCVDEKRHENITGHCTCCYFLSIGRT